MRPSVYLLPDTFVSSLPVFAPTSARMGVKIKFSDLYRAPEVNPVNRKARSVPALNPINMYGRVFFFSWFGFMIAFWAWYTFPPLVSKPDLHTFYALLGLTPL